MKDKVVAALLAFFLGSIGIHRFYLGQTGLGILYIFLLFIGVSPFLGFIDCVIFVFQSREAFDKKYNSKHLQLAAMNRELITLKKEEKRLEEELSQISPTYTDNTYLFFDTETTGLPNDWDAPVSDTDNWPRMVQLGCLLCDGRGNVIEEKDFIIKPDGYQIPTDAFLVHHISTEKALEEGIDLETALVVFQSLLSKASHIVGHNIGFDANVIGSEFYRKTGKNPLYRKKKICTMKSEAVIDYCALTPLRNGSYKWPKLTELHQKLFGSGFDGTHNASMDVKATAKCFFALQNKGIL